jgi:predicted nucleic acid-binding Zn ribbon protein
MSEKSSLEPLGGLIGTVIRGAGLEAGLRNATTLLEWESRVGPRVAEVTRVQGVEGRTVFVDVRSSAWLHELTFMRRQILEQLNRGRSDVPFERIVFRLAESPMETKQTPSRIPE